MKVPPTLVKRAKEHFFTLDCGVGVVLGCNGFVWLSERAPSAGGGGDGVASMQSAEAVQALEELRREHAAEELGVEARARIARVRNSLLALQAAFAPVHPLTIGDVYEASLRANMDVPDMLVPGAAHAITASARERDVFAA